MHSARDLTNCGRCLAEIVWTVTEAGKRMAMNSVPDDLGNQAVHKGADGVLRSRALNATAAVELRPHEWRGMPHAATCPRPQPRQPRRTPQTLRRPVVRRWPR